MGTLRARAEVGKWSSDLTATGIELRNAPGFFSLSAIDGGEGWGEEADFLWIPRPAHPWLFGRLLPRDFLNRRKQRPEHAQILNVLVEVI